MQYDGYAFSYNGQPTIVDRATGQPVPLNRRVSSGDYQQLNALYRCDGTTNPPITNDPNPTGSPGDCKDENTNCAYWASIGECSSNPGLSIFIGPVDHYGHCIILYLRLHAFVLSIELWSVFH